MVQVINNHIEIGSKGKKVTENNSLHNSHFPFMDFITRHKLVELGQKEKKENSDSFLSSSLWLANETK